MNLSDYFDEEEKRRVATLKPLVPMTPEELADYERRMALLYDVLMSHRNQPECHDENDIDYCDYWNNSDGQGW